jgi:hypothetical protein
MSVRPTRVPGASPATPTTRRRCEPCTGVLPLDFTPRHAAEQPGEMAQVCSELGEHDLDSGSELCSCGRHELRICARCLTPDESGCAAMDGAS